MSNINQLLSKAMSTTSEEEAMSCLRMARKKGKTFDSDITSSDYNGHGAKYWYEKAALYYDKAKEKNDGLIAVAAQQKHFWNMYKNEEESVTRLLREKVLLQREINELKNKSDGRWWMVPVMAIQFILIIVLAHVLAQMTG
jgi:TPR repeat protein